MGGEAHHSLPILDWPGTTRVHCVLDEGTVHGSGTWEYLCTVLTYCAVNGVWTRKEERGLADIAATYRGLRTGDERRGEGEKRMRGQDERGSLLHSCTVQL